MNYHLEITKKSNCRGKRNNILTFLFYVLNFPKDDIVIFIFVDQFVIWWTSKVTNIVSRYVIINKWKITPEKIKRETKESQKR